MTGKFRVARKRCIREEDQKSNSRVIIDKISQCDIFYCYWYIKRGPIITGIYVGRVFSKDPIMCVFF